MVGHNWILIDKVNNIYKQKSSCNFSEIYGN